MPPSRGIHRLAVATAASTFVLLFVGGLVTSTGSALAVPDWPLSLGPVSPPMVGGMLFVTGPGWTSPPTAVRPDERPIALLAGATTAAVFAQLVLGALMRHLGAGLAIPDFPLAFGRVLPSLVTPLVTVHFAHRIGAVIVALSVATTVARAARSPRAELRRPALVAAALVVVQVALGASIIWTRRAVVPTTSHVALGAALLATCF